MMLEWIYSIFVFLGLRHTSSNGSMTKIPHSGGSSNNHGASTLGDSMGVEGQALLASSNGTCLQPKRTRRSRIPDKPNISFRSVKKIIMKIANIYNFIYEKSSKLCMKKENLGKYMRSFRLQLSLNIQKQVIFLIFLQPKRTGLSRISTRQSQYSFRSVIRASALNSNRGVKVS